MENETLVAKAYPKCSQRRMMPNLNARAVGGDIAKVLVAVEKRALTTWRGGDYRSNRVTAPVCGNCGYTEFYSEDPQQPWEVWQQINR